WWNRTHAVVCTGELPADRRDYVRVTTNICGTQHCITKIICRAECPERSGKCPGCGIARVLSRLGDQSDVRENASLRLTGQCGVQCAPELAASIEHRGCLAGGS